MLTRRTFVSLAKLVVAAALPGPAHSVGRPAKVLFLGGRGFFGPVAVESLVAAGHEVVLANRGMTNPEMFSELRFVRCDRLTPDGSGLEGLRTLLRRERFDWVVDTWQGNAMAVVQSADLVRGRVGSYQYISTLAVYRDWSQAGIDESYPLTEIAELSLDWSTDHRYAVRKTQAERELMRLLPGDCCLFRSHGMRGYRIDEPRYEPYWPVRIQRGGDVLVPGDGTHFGQVTDMVSLARFMVHAGERRVTGAYNVAYAPFRFREYLRAVLKVTGSSPRFHCVPEEFLAQHDVRPYRDIPLWRPLPSGSYRFDVSAAKGAGLRNRPLEELIADELAGYRNRNPDDGFRLSDSGALASELEQRIISEWRGCKPQGTCPTSPNLY